MSGFSWRTPGVDLRRLITDVAAVVLLIAVAVIGFAATFEGPQYLVAAIGALVIGLALAWVGLRWRWGVLSLSGATIGAYFLFGGALALPHTAWLGVIPTIETWRQLAIGVVTSWKDLLTTVPPVAPSDGHLIVPFLMTLAASVLGGSLALRAKHAAWALLPLALYLGLAILMGTAQPTAPLLQGVIFAIVAVLWLALRALWPREQQRLRERALQASQHLRLRLQAEPLRLAAATARLQAQDPRRVLSRGYAWIERGDGRPVGSVAGLKAGDALQATWADGRAAVVVDRIEPGAPSLDPTLPATLSPGTPGEA
jgi:hypothetical protein